MGPRAKSAKPTVEEDEQVELKKITISMPDWMLDELRWRARQRGITVTELIRRAVSLEKMLFKDPESEVVVRNQDTGKEVVIRIL